MYSDRKNKIVELLRENTMSIKELSEALSVSEMTIRRDVRELNFTGVTTQYRGGVALWVSQAFKAFDIRVVHDKEDKIRLAKKAAEYVRDGMFIFIDNSSTCFYILPFLKKFKDLKVVTNSSAVATELGEMGIKVKMACGNYVARDKCVTGSEAEAYIKSYHYDIAFLSATAYNDKIIMCCSEAYTHIRRAVLSGSERNVLLMTPSKKKKGSKFVLCKIEDVELVT